MYIKKLSLLLTFTITCNFLFAQNTFDVTDSLPVTLNGLKMGYTILKEEEKEVGSKGNFSRFVISFYVTNITNEAKIFLHKSGWSIGNDISPEVARFDCSNATGARLTAKTVTLQASACNILAIVEDKDCASNKTIKNKRFVDIGYWIKAGETLTSRQIMIVPLNEKPVVKVTFLLSNVAGLGSIENANSGREDFVKIK